LLVLILGFSYYYFVYKNNNTTTIGTKKVVEIIRGDINVSVSGTGQVFAGNQVDLRPQVAGDGLDVVAVKVENNQVVKKNDIIAILDSSDLKQKIQEAELNFKSAEIKLKQARKQYDSKKEDDIWAKNLQKISFEQSQISLNKAYKDLEDYYIRAPFDGVVTGLDASAGDSISRDEILASVITTDLKATISLNEIDAVRVKVGNKVKLTFEALNGLSVEGKVSKVATIGKVAQGVVTYDVEISFDSPNELLKPGMSVSVEIEIDNAKNAVIIPSEAIKKNGGKPFVLVEKGLNTEKREIEIGLNDDIYTEVKSGLKEGEKVIVSEGIVKKSSSTSNSSGSIIPMGGSRMR
jgi:HlyD family secretion protein